MTKYDVIVIGAGPYGLATATHLRTIQGLDVRVFGEPMAFWERNMPTGMLLRSNWTATQIASPNGRLSLEEYQKSTGDRFSKPVPLENFVRYGKWYQENSVPDVDQRSVTRLEVEAKRFRVTLGDGESIMSRRVVIAAGIGSFAWRPPEFDGLPVPMVSHASEHRSLSSFAAKDVLVVGCGQSALESAALLHEAGARVEVVARSPHVVWLGGWASRTLHSRLGAGIRDLLYAPTDVGPAGLSQLCARPDLVRRLPRKLQDRLRKRAVRAAGARWLVQRLVDVPVHLGHTVVTTKQTGEKVRVRLDDHREKCVDHILLGTGYRVDISRYKFLSPELTSSIKQCNGYPILAEGLETSVPGLHIVGAPAAWSLGPLMQFVSGTKYVGNVLTRYVAQHAN